MSFKFGDPVVVLNLWTPTGRADCGGTIAERSYLARMRGEGWLTVRVGGVNLNLHTDKLMCSQAYFDAYRSKTLPEGAAGAPWFLEGNGTRQINEAILGSSSEPSEGDNK